jgi:hypothetical protein
MTAPNTAPSNGAFRKSNRNSSHHFVLSPNFTHFFFAMTEGLLSYGIIGATDSLLDGKKDT